MGSRRSVIDALELWDAGTWENPIYELCTFWGNRLSGFTSMDTTDGRICMSIASELLTLD